MRETTDELYRDFEVVVYGCIEEGDISAAEEVWPDMHSREDHDKLGRIEVSIQDKVTIINMFVRENRRVSDEALRSCLELIKNNCSGRTIGIPISSGLDPFVKTVIEDELSEENVTLIKI